MGRASKKVIDSFRFLCTITKHMCASYAQIMYNILREGAQSWQCGRVDTVTPDRCAVLGVPGSCSFVFSECSYTDVCGVSMLRQQRQGQVVSDNDISAESEMP
jgi:hypothetical protein